MTTRFDILGIGNAIVDVVAQADDTFLSRHDMRKGSMTLIDSDAAEALYTAMPPGQESSGGSAANTCAVAAALGARVAYLGKVANDQLGTVFRHDMTAIGVHFPSTPLYGGASTARCLIVVTPDGQRTMHTYLGACVSFDEADVTEALCADAAVTYLEGYLFDPPAAQRAFRRAAAAAHAAGRQVALSLSDAFCVDRHRAAFLELVKQDVDILFANETEVTSLYEENNFEAAAERARADVGTRRADPQRGGQRDPARRRDGGDRRRAGACGGHDGGGRCVCRRVSRRADDRQAVAGVRQARRHRGGRGHQPLRRAAAGGSQEAGGGGRVIAQARLGAGRSSAVSSNITMTANDTMKKPSR